MKCTRRPRASTSSPGASAFIEAHLQPIGQSTDEFPGVLLPNAPARLGRFGRRLTAMALAVQSSAGLAREDVLGLPRRAPPPRRDLPVLYGISRHVIPRPRDWDARRHVLGYWTLPAAAVEHFARL